MDIPRFETERLILRAITRDDRCAIFENYSDPDVANWFFDRPYTQIQQADQLISEFIARSAEGKGMTWAILLKKGDEFIGTCSYENFTVESQGEIGFDLAKRHWGHGYMTEALRVIITYGFTVLDLIKIEAITYSHNVRARRMLERLGFSVDSADEGLHRYALNRADWR